ncbi:MAG: carbamate kinase [Ruminococcus sp.]|nr:carbamate kinase [Ruminococcus sp.]
MKRIVVALGGNALGKNLTEQFEAVKVTAKAIADLIGDGSEVVITHGNGPQVGKIDAAMNALLLEDPTEEKTSLSMCVAMSQAYIGYDIQNALRKELMRRGMYKPVVTIITQVEVSNDDPAMKNPTKPIGKFMTEEQAQRLKEHYGYAVAEDSGRGWRRVVASPQPQYIIEIDAIRASLQAGSVVICCGGGGIPVRRKDDYLKGCAAVIDKDYCSALLAENLNADVLLILTAIDKVKIHFGTADEQSLDRVSLNELCRYIDDGEFASGSMLPKAEAAARFVEGGKGRKAIIAALEEAGEAVKGKAGTVIFNEDLGVRN